MEAAAKMCDSIVQRLVCGGSNPATTDRACYDACTDLGYTGGGKCDMHKPQRNTYRCICRKPCAAEQTEARAGDAKQYVDAGGDMKSRTMAESVQVIE